MKANTPIDLPWQTRLRLDVVFALLCLALLQPAFGQDVLSGRISNAATGKNLQGARVEITGQNRVTFTDAEGIYRFDQLSPGPIALSVSYTGLNTESITLVVEPGISSQRDIALTSDVYMLSKFVVSGEREGNALAITLQRQSTGVKNVVSTDAFGSLGANPADLVARLPGVFAENDGSGIRYLQVRGMPSVLSSVTMDGNRLADAASAGTTREFQFIQVNADTVERIEVTKSPTPEMDGDSIGGAINMISKSAFDRTGRQISGSAGIIYRAWSGVDDPRPNFTFSYSDIIGKKFGVAFNYGYRRHFSPIPATSRNYEDKVTDPVYTYQFGTEDYFLTQTRWGGGVKFDYKASDRTRFYVNTTHNRMQEYSYPHFATYTTSQTVATRDSNGNLTGTGAIVPGYTTDLTEWRPVANSQVTASALAALKDVKAIHVEVGADHRFQTWSADYNIYSSRSTTSYPHTETAAITATGIGMRIEDTGDPYFPRVTQTAGPDVTNINSYLSNTYNRNVFGGTDKYQGGALNIKKVFNSPVNSWIKAGLRVRKQERDVFLDQYRWNYVGPDGVMGVNRATGQNDDNLAQFVQPTIIRWGKLDRYPLLPWLTRPGADSYYKPYDYRGNNFATALREHPEYFIENVALSTMTKLNNRQQFQETISAGYLMGNVELGRLSILGGLRVESTKVDAEGAKNEVTPAEAALRAAFVGPLTDAEIRRRNTAQYGGRLATSGEYRTIFPGLHFKYEPIRGLLARLSYSTSIGRPPIGTLIPRTTIDNNNRVISTSNPSLKPQIADNFDLGVEYYFEPAGMISATVFLKEMQDFIFTKGGQIVGAGPDNGFEGDYVGYALTSQSNGGRARVRGFEIAYQQQFTFLPGFWSGFGAYANYARNETYGDYGGASATTKVAGFVPETANFGISYIREPLSIRLQLNHSGRRLITVSPSVARLLYERPRSTVDLKAVYKFSRHYSFYLDVTNLNSAEERAREFEGGRRGLNYNTGPLLLTGINARY